MLTAQPPRHTQRPQCSNLPRQLMLQWAAWNPRQITTQNVNSECGKHEGGANPEAPVTMHSSPVWARIRLATFAAVSFAVVFAARHICLQSTKRFAEASKLAVSADNITRYGVCVTAAVT